MDLEGKKVLLVGLGILGGGTATANFLMKEGATLTITDLKKENEVSSSLKKLKGSPKLVLGEHREEDFLENDIIVLGPGVSYKNHYVSLARENGKQIENDYTLFASYFKLKNPESYYIGITGTRGKTTIVHWVHHFISQSVIGGNIPEKGLLDIVSQKTNLFVLELSSFNLEFTAQNTTPPHIAAITNIFRDHLDRYKTIEEYMDTKSNIFENQTSGDFLILNKDNGYTDYFVNKKPKSDLYFISTSKLDSNLNGIFFDNDEIIFQKEGNIVKIYKLKNFMPLHKKSNLLFALLISYFHINSWDEILPRIELLPEISFRQEVIYKDRDLAIINDSASTIPEATIAALDSFKDQGKSIVLITGGTDKNLEFPLLANKISHCIKKEKLFLLKGSATNKLIDELVKIGYLEDVESVKQYLSVDEIVSDIQNFSDKEYVILFSPGATSFERFKNEFDRGNTFNEVIDKYYSKKK
ncbi:UDP-N-acetylmuramoyl-L-alanine--D-glutamate ligase [Candidatus Wolfebacteria bacterium]|nr:MAG: UDP-N-acetylmuramoyl-L-alanine--D-glutamate ligase [Candidatus Wolfebacteria bacterium]